MVNEKVHTRNNYIHEKFIIFTFIINYKKWNEIKAMKEENWKSKKHSIDS
jgi:hypothetical protein